MYKASVRDATQTTKGTTMSSIAVGMTAARPFVPVLGGAGLTASAVFGVGMFITSKLLSATERKEFSKYYENTFHPKVPYSSMTVIRLRGTRPKDQEALAKILGIPIQEIQKLGVRVIGYQLQGPSGVLYAYGCIGQSLKDAMNVTLEEKAYDPDVQKHIGYYSAMLALSEQYARITKSAKTALDSWKNRNKGKRR